MGNFLLLPSAKIFLADLIIAKTFCTQKSHIWIKYHYLLEIKKIYSFPCKSIKSKLPDGRLMTSKMPHMTTQFLKLVHLFKLGQKRLIKN